MASLQGLAALALRRAPRSAYRDLPPSLLSRSVSSRTPKADARMEKPHKAGFLEQHEKSLLPEIFAETAPRERHFRDDRNADPEFKKALVRDATLQLREQVVSGYLPKEGDAEGRDQAPNLVVLDGVKGVGKTSIIEQTAAFARLKGFIVLYIPSPAAWIDGRGFFCSTAVEGKDPVMDGLSAVRYYDRPHQMHEVFKTLLRVHSDDFAKLDCHPEFASELTENCASLRDLVELGDRLLDDLDSNWRQTPANAGEIFHQLIQELCACREKPVAIIIDNYDKFVGMTCMVNERKERMHANSIRVIAEEFGRDAIEKTAEEMTNGFVMLAVDPSYAFESWRKSRVRSGVDFPLSNAALADPFGKQWIADFKERIGSPEAQRKMYIDVPRLSASELKALCSTFVQGGLRKLIDDDYQDAETARLIALAGGRGDLMRKIAICR